jgi:hypothetical protein
VKKIILIYFTALNCAFGLGQNCIDTALIDTTALCPAVFDPVCGCDGVTYDNACLAVVFGGVTSYDPGPCPLLEPDTCLSVPNGVDFGACAMVLGVIRQNDSCFTMSGCSMIGSNGIDYAGYFFNSTYQCNSLCLNDTFAIIGCIDSALIDVNVLCNGVYDPVCGCDSVSYYNACVAVNYFGISQFQPGECAFAGTKENSFGEFRVVPNPVNEHLVLAGRKINDVKKTLVYSLEGRLQCQGMGNEVLDVHTFTRGRYLLEILLNDGTRSIVFFDKI